LCGWRVGDGDFAVGTNKKAELGEFTFSSIPGLTGWYIQTAKCSLPSLDDCRGV
jgi:hypothetical protein